MILEPVPGWTGTDFVWQPLSYMPNEFRGCLLVLQVRGLKKTFSKNLTKIICVNLKKYYLYTTKQNYLKMSNEIKIKTKSVKFLTSKVKGWLKLTDGSKTHFEVQNNGEWEQWGNSRENLCVSVPFIYELVDFYLNEN
jgi:hypothetical protein